MKLILIHAEQNARNHLKQLLSDLDHIVVAESDTPRQLLGDIARHQPHAIVVGELASVFTDGIFPRLQDTVVLVPVLRLPDGATDEMLLSLLAESLEKVRIEHQSRPTRPYSTDEQRLVLMDDRYQKYAQKEKLGSDLSDDFDREKEIFIRQVHCARNNHSAAKRYLSHLLKTDRGLRVEVAYRLVHASYKVYWLRDHALRWASVLAHYIEGIQLEYLPSSASPSPQLDFLHYEAPPESLYAAAALVGHGIRSSLEPAFCSIMTKKYTGQSTEELQAEAIYLSGWCALLREVTIAQVKIMTQVLDSESSWYSGKRPRRGIHRAEGIYTDWWHLPTLPRNPAKMRDLAYLSVKDWLAPASATAVAPYRAFLEAHLVQETVAGKNGERI
jgi:hypothetical protein